MKIILDNLGKKYNQGWIFRNINFEFSEGKSYAITGANGSGKSTFLQLIAGNLSASEGKIQYLKDGLAIEVEEIFRQISFSSPYLELIEEFTLEENIAFYSGFKPFALNLTVQEVIDISGLGEKAMKKELKYFSSGMKQRVRLVLAILGVNPIVLLDEPASNLDRKGIEWYKDLVNQYSKNKIIIVCSNQQTDECSFCSSELNMENFKNIRN
jgi:ABC-type multidrug transport system ATPase subunit